MKRYNLLILILCCFVFFSSCSARINQPIYHYYPSTLQHTPKNELVKIVVFDPERLDWTKSETAILAIVLVDDMAVNYNPYRGPGLTAKWVAKTRGTEKEEQFFVTPASHSLVIHLYVNGKRVKIKGPILKKALGDGPIFLFDGNPGEIYWIKAQEMASKEWFVTIERGPVSLQPPPSKSIMNTNSLIYLYRPRKGAGSGFVWPVAVDSTNIKDPELKYMRNGMLCPIVVEPSRVLFRVSETKINTGVSKEIDVEPGQVYYLKTTTSFGWKNKIGINEVPPEVGEKEIRNTWLNSECDDVPLGYYPYIIE